MILLSCFPADYKAAYAEELEYAIRQATEAAVQEGQWALFKLICRELRDLPGARADFARSTALFEALVGADPQDAAMVANLIAALMNQSIAEARVGEIKQARQTLARALELRAGCTYGEARRSMEAAMRLLAGAESKSPLARAYSPRPSPAKYHRR